MKLDAKILIKIPAKRIQQYIKRIIHHNEVGFIPSLQSWFNICRSINMIHHINRGKEKNHSILSIDAEKTFDKIQHPFLIKTFHSVGIEGTYLNIIKTIYKEPTTNNILNGENLIAFMIGMPTLTTVVQHSTMFCCLIAEAIRQQKEIKGIQISKEIKLHSSQMT